VKPLPVTNRLGLDIRSELGSMLPLFAAFAAFSLVLGMIMVNLQQSAIADMRAGDFASSAALIATRSSESQARAILAEIGVLTGQHFELEIEQLDPKTVAATVCLIQPLVFDLFAQSSASVCERRMARMVDSWAN
jgi:hypothetical protein